MVGGAVNAALANFSKALAAQGLRDDVNVNWVHPGLTVTERLDQIFEARAQQQGKTRHQFEKETVAKEGIRRLGRPEDVAALVRPDLDEVDAEIRRQLHSDVALIDQVAHYIIASGGKRLRPLLVVMAAHGCGYTGRDHIKAAAIIEFIHTATLLHDDVVDESELRRGRESANALFGNQPSVLVGDFLFSRAFQLMVEDGSLQVLKILSDASAVIAEGEVMQLMTANDTQTSEEAYLEVIRSKTATLFAAAAQIGAVVADRPRVQERFGTHQVVVDESRLIRPVGEDRPEGLLRQCRLVHVFPATEEDASVGKHARVELVDVVDRDRMHVGTV